MALTRARRGTQEGPGGGAIANPVWFAEVPAREGEMKESHFLEMLYGILLVPIVVIVAGPMWTLWFLAAQSDPNVLVVWAAAFLVWLLLILEGFNRMIFDRRALPWLPLPGPLMPLPFRFVVLLLMYAAFGFVGYKMATEPW